MPPVPPRVRRRAGGSAPIRAARRLGEVRRAQLITTYGVGAMIAVENESFLVRGIDSWDISKAPFVREPRLANHLHVKGFRLPPALDADEATDGVRAIRFPTMYSCPQCRTLQPFRKFNSRAGKAECVVCQEDLVPSRFVMACVHGHLEDFPYWKWVHRGKQRTEPGLCGGELRFRADGSTASLRAVLISCTCGAGEVSMEGSFRRQALKDLGIRCGGRRPWLKDAKPVNCEEQPRTLQRGSSSVWFPVMHSALSIPPWSEPLAKLVAPLYEKLKRESDEGIRAYLRIEGVLRHHPGNTPDDVIGHIEKLRQLESAAVDPAIPSVSGEARTQLYRDEYDRLGRAHAECDDVQSQDFVCEFPEGAVEPLTGSHGIEQVMLVKRLREVRALQGFTRVEEPRQEAVTDVRRAEIALDKPAWLPAFEVIGEGVFLRLDGDRLRSWEQQPGPIARAQRIRANHERLLHERAGTAGSAVPASPATPRFLLIHALAHVLINEWSLDGGYPASALRERLYVDKDMAGVLLYTATSDSAGSLGGIVAQGEPERLVKTLHAALQRASWCSNDPLCMESEASGVDSLNLAACHACLLLPETSCENNNILLDRAALVGTQDGGVPGFF
ncbi:DrmB family protein [Streptomyces sp. NPDC088197]|uniref:DrmB family protein n=1 Tax=unclassified Streptomyces TaxID=2593676 RepID=UPI0037FDE7ED